MDGSEGQRDEKDLRDSGRFVWGARTRLDYKEGRR